MTRPQSMSPLDFGTSKEIVIGFTESSADSNVITLSHPKISMYTSMVVSTQKPMLVS